MLTGKVSIVKVGMISFEGILVDNGKYAVTAQQTAELFCLNQTNVARDLKRLMGDGYSFFQVSIENDGHNRSENLAMYLPDFETAVTKLDRKGNKLAQDFRDDLVGTMLVQLFSDSFGAKFDEEDRQLHLTKRQIGKDMRNDWYNFAWSYLYNNGTREYQIDTILACLTNNVYHDVFGKPAAEIREERNIPENDLTRDYFTYEELSIIESYERVMYMQMKHHKKTPQQALSYALHTFQK